MSLHFHKSCAKDIRKCVAEHPLPLVKGGNNKTERGQFIQEDLHDLKNILDHLLCDSAIRKERDPNYRSKIIRAMKKGEGTPFPENSLKVSMPVAKIAQLEGIFSTIQPVGNGLAIGVLPHMPMADIIDKAKRLKKDFHRICFNPE